jgi:hypothetical protein
MKSNGRIWQQESAVAAGENVVIPLPSRGPSTLAVTPGVGATAYAYWTISSTERLLAGTAQWYPCNGLGTSGVLTSPDGDFCPSNLSAYKVASVGGSTLVEVCQ